MSNHLPQRTKKGIKKKGKVGNTKLFAETYAEDKAKNSKDKIVTNFLL